MGRALNVGYDRLVEELDGGIDVWTAAGQPAARTELITPGQVGDRRVLDVRQRQEFAGGHLPGAAHVELGGVAAAADRLPATPTVLMCGRGNAPPARPACSNAPGTGPRRAGGWPRGLEHAGHR